MNSTEDERVKGSLEKIQISVRNTFKRKPGVIGGTYVHTSTMASHIRTAACFPTQDPRLPYCDGYETPGVADAWSAEQKAVCERPWMAMISCMDKYKSSLYW